MIKVNQVVEQVFVDTQTVREARMGGGREHPVGQTQANTQDDRKEVCGCSGMQRCWLATETSQVRP